MEKKKKPSAENLKLRDKDCLIITQEKREFETLYPNLMSEVSENLKRVKIDSFEIKAEENNEVNLPLKIEALPRELINPGAIDFIRRCVKLEEAIEILDYLLDRKELDFKEYNDIKERIMKEDGLKKTIIDGGGFKKPGYYLRKYYKKNPKNPNPKQDKINKQTN